MQEIVGNPEILRIIKSIRINWYGQNPRKIHRKAKKLMEGASRKRQYKIANIKKWRNNSSISPKKKIGKQ